MQRSHRFVDALRRLLAWDTRSLEFYIGWVSLLYGAWLLAPGDYLGSAAVFAHQRKVLPEWAWGTLYITVGQFRLASILLDIRRLRQMACMMGIALWSAVSYCMFRGEPLLFLSVHSALIAFSNFYALAHLALVEARQTALEEVLSPSALAAILEEMTQERTGSGGG